MKQNDGEEVREGERIQILTSNKLLLMRILASLV